MTGKGVFATMCVAMLGVVLSTRCGAVGDSTPIQTPSPTPTEGIHQVRCGDGVVTPPFEGCDDGNLFSGDGCGPDCHGEIITTAEFEPWNERVLTASFDQIVQIKGQIAFVRGQTSPPVIRSLETEPQGVPQSGILCIRALVPPGQPLGPGNLGPGQLGPEGSSANVLAATLLLEEWLNPSDGFRVDLGPDGIACTDDDPGLPMATQHERELHLALRLDSCGGDINHDGTVKIEELVTAVHNALGGCPP